MTNKITLETDDYKIEITKEGNEKVIYNIYQTVKKNRLTLTFTSTTCKILLNDLLLTDKHITYADTRKFADNVVNGAKHLKLAGLEFKEIMENVKVKKICKSIAKKKGVSFNG